MTEVVERWLPWPRRPQYTVSDLGRVIGPRGRILVQSLDHKGYPRVSAGRIGPRRKVHVHVMVLETFVGPCPDGMEARHLDDVSTDSRLVKLAWGTRAENWADRKRNSLAGRGR